MVVLSRRKFIYSAVALAAVPQLLLAGDPVPVEYFQHGLASGDGTQDRIIIWTRITAKHYDGSLVYWELAESKNFSVGLRSGSCKISADHDYTVKIDVAGLASGKIYYYRFKYKGNYSIIGTTSTLPDSLAIKDLHIAVVSCNNWEDGYFNSFRFIAQKEEVDMVLHLGDYIYEYATGQYGNKESKRINDPLHEIITLSDYRQRYAQYRTDSDLQLLHLRKPFYMIWDDHELANDAYKDGAKNHQSNEGKWSDRKSAAIQAYLEWLPVRAKSEKDIVRKFTIGDDMELFLLDERAQGRTVQFGIGEEGIDGSERAILGEMQYQWLAAALKNSKAKWKLIANQVMFAGYQVAPGFKTPKYSDWWLGYPHERKKIIGLLEEHQISNVVFLTGDHHQSFVLAIHPEHELKHYQTPYSKPPLAWELLTPSITSKNGDRLTNNEIDVFEKMLYDKSVNPHLVFADIKNHGYYIATLSKSKLQSSYYFVDNILSKNAIERKEATFNIDAETFTIS
ncbi:MULTISPECIES: alkaline phosphatase [unclassified Sphingobacterium]|uniref:alkaline phosphatase D family protein n=1 Tax=unclassified Sphingobacterium TaxID=2609468 RepID=UPI00104AF741|nr:MULTISPECIES: alkaline phosphatase D family protein [unclassified Sphingobacterium]MCS3557639.1 alkaline phosphatase D [Sphingobacterium sp. JUb21]TCQ95091.1 alkaline phosphatase D [Sphingobacterium sp. JUb20]